MLEDIKKELKIVEEIVKTLDKEKQVVFVYTDIWIDYYVKYEKEIS